MRQALYTSAQTDLPAQWAGAQIASWREAAPYDLEALALRLDGLAASSPMIFLYDFSYNHVALRPKAAQAAASDDGLTAELLRRAELYRDLFQTVLSRFGARYRFTLAIDVDDHPTDRQDTPVFSFQKHMQARLIPLPDVDLLAYDYFVAPEYIDSQDFSSKVDKAVFAGATTGGIITSEVVDGLSLPRLRAAVFFRDFPEVQFTLPKIVQCDGVETAEKIRALDVGGKGVSWSDQLGFRYLISIDGNGATCSRVAIGLHSRSALLKYDSPFRLYYFEGLIPDREFVAITADQDVLSFLAAERTQPGRGEAVAEAGRRFARRYLSRPSVARYVSQLLDGYGQMLGAFSKPAEETSFIVDAFGHVQNVGDLWAGMGAWLGTPSGQDAIEGFGLQTGPMLDPDDLAYQAVLDNGLLSDVASGGGFCGTRGRNRPLRGLRAWLIGPAASQFDLTYEGSFKDGSLVGLVSAGSTCRSASGAELVGFRVLVRRRDSPGSAKQFDGAMEEAFDEV